MKSRLLFFQVLEERDPVYTIHGNGTVTDVEIQEGRGDRIRVLVQHEDGWAGNPGNQPIWFPHDQIAFRGNPARDFPMEGENASQRG